MAKGLEEAANKVGLKINAGKSKFMIKGLVAKNLEQACLTVVTENGQVLESANFYLPASVD